MNIWAITDNRIGNTKQIIALAQAIGDYKELPIKFSFLSKLPNKILGSFLFATNRKFSEPKPDLIISAGRKLARIALALKKKYGCKIIHIMYPTGLNINKFDYIITPNHDNVLTNSNIIKITGSICETILSEPVPNNVAVLLGRISKGDVLSLANFINANHANYFVTTSRRTKRASIKLLEALITKPIEIYKFGSSQPNPYNDYIKKASGFIISGDSVNMLTEAAHTGKGIYIIETKTKKKFLKFWQELYQLKMAKKLQNNLEFWHYTPLNNLKTVLELIHI